MADNIEHLILEHLKALRNEMREVKAAFRSEFEMAKARLNSLEHQIGGFGRQLASVHEDIAGTHVDVAGIHGRLDKLDARLERIERRLDLASAP